MSARNPSLWFKLRNHPSLFCLHMHPTQAAVIFREIARELKNSPDAVQDFLEKEALIAEERKRIEEGMDYV